MKTAPAGKFAAAFAAAGLFASSAASAAPMTLGAIDPLVAVSVLGTASSQAAVCAAGASAAAAAGAAAAAQGNANCVLPVTDVPPPAQVAEMPPPSYIPAAPLATGGGFGVLPLLLGLAAVAGGLALILGGDGDDSIQVPVSPS